MRDAWGRWKAKGSKDNFADDKRKDPTYEGKSDSLEDFAITLFPAHCVDVCHVLEPNGSAVNCGVITPELSDAERLTKVTSFATR